MFHPERTPLSIPADDDDDRRDATNKSQIFVVRAFFQISKFSVEIFNSAFHCDVNLLKHITGTPHFNTPHS
jgi:hypothetical protein